MDGRQRTPRDRVIRDPLYGYVEIPPELQLMVDHPLMQRLRHISQTSLAASVYPSMTGTRFEHSLGTMHLAGLAWDSAWAASPRITRSKILAAVKSDVPELATTRNELVVELLALAVRIVGLTHDLGHPPYSHALESFYERHGEKLISGYKELQNIEGSRAMHELAGKKLLHQLLLAGRLPAGLQVLAEAITAAPMDEFGWAGMIHGLVDGEIDVDRLDYLMRDSQRAGADFGAIDYRRLLESLSILWDPGTSNSRVVVDMRALSAVESLLALRMQSYRYIFFHPRVVAVDFFLDRALEALWQLARFDATAVDRNDQETELFNLAPNLDYINDTFQSATSKQAAALEPTGNSGIIGPRGRLVDVVGSANARRYALALQVSVDDSAVHQWVSASSRLIQSWMYGRTWNPDDDVDFYAKQLIAYESACFSRSANFAILWKDRVDYDAFAVSAKSSIESAIHSVLQDGETGAWINLPKQFRLPPSSDDSSSAWMHYAVEEIIRVDIDNFGSRVTRALNDTVAAEYLGTVEGFWEFTHRKFTAVKTDAESGTYREKQQQFAIYRQGEKHNLDTLSPYPDGLKSIQTKRLPLYGYFLSTRYHEESIGHDSSFPVQMRKALLHPSPEGEGGRDTFSCAFGRALAESLREQLNL